MLKKTQIILRREGLSAVPRRAWAKLLRGLASSHDEVRARRKSSYRLNANSDPFQLNPRLGKAALAGVSVEECIPQQVAQHYLDHRFDLLGSGWVQVRHGMHCRGMAGYRCDVAEPVEVDGDGLWLKSRLNASNLPVAQRIWQCVDPNYVPIDWQLDFKSGYRWSEATWAARLRYGHRLGVDVKVPWELARMQHLPQMALRAAAHGVNDEEAHRLVREIRNQWLDFIATNPPGFGVNWRCPMDIAIRGANWCLAWDILRAAGFPLDQEDTTILAHSLYDHGSYIVRHLEWSNERANHYLANISGLTFIAAYLPETQETDRWLAFSIGQLQTETLRQFLPDGGNFEGSTAYHRLSLEMVLYTTALIFGLPEAKLAKLAAINPGEYRYLPKGAGLPKQWTLHETGKTGQGALRATHFRTDFVERLQRAVDFFAAILKLDGTFPQIGDNDSGRFFKLQPVYSVMTVGEAQRRYLNLEGYNELNEAQAYFFEEHCYGKHLLDVASELGIFQESNRDSAGGEVELDLITSLTGGLKFVTDQQYGSSISFGESKAISELSESIAVHPDALMKTFKRKISQPMEVRSVEYRNFPNFGLHVWRSIDLLVTVRSLETQIIYPMGHFHDDQLGVGIFLNGISLVCDPGTYVYTPLPEKRNNYRGRGAHFPTSKHVSRSMAPFSPPEFTSVQVYYAGPYGFGGSYSVDGSVDHLALHISDESVSIFALSEIHDCISEKQSSQCAAPLPYSPGYGIQERIDFSTHHRRV